MGMYDTVHTGTRCGQTKALGKTLRNISVGAPARLYPAPMDEAAFEVWLAGNTEPVADDFQVAMREGGYLICRDGHLTGWHDHLADDLPLFDSLGQPLPADQPLPTGYLYRQGRRAAALTSIVEGSATLTRAWEVLPVLYGTVPSTELDPQSTEFAQQRALEVELAQAALAEMSGDPGDCAHCAAIRAGR